MLCTKITLFCNALLSLRMVISGILCAIMVSLKEKSLNSASFGHRAIAALYSSNKSHSFHLKGLKRMYKLMLTFQTTLSHVKGISSGH